MFRGLIKLLNELGALIKKSTEKGSSSEDPFSVPIKKDYVNRKGVCIGHLFLWSESPMFMNKG